MGTQASSERLVLDRFARRYELGQSEVMLAIERSVCGCAYGATSWTTVAEVQTIIQMLDLHPQARLLEVGAGSGWPGLHLAAEIGCDITLTDLPIAGLRIALRRARTDRIAGACWGSVADAARLPFRDGAFDAVVHSDVLCCLVEKLAALKSCRRVVRANGNMVFSVIRIATGLSAEAYEIARTSGPPFIETDAPYSELLQRAGWRITDHKDLTANYQTSVTRMLELLEQHDDEIKGLFGEDDASNELDRKRATVKTLSQGLLCRELFVVAATA